MGTEIIGLGVYYPEEVLEKNSYTRRRANSYETAVFMGGKAIKDCLEITKRNASEVDLILSFVGLPDYEYPADINIIQKEVGLTNTTCYTINTACASFLSALKIAEAMINAGMHKSILILTVMNWLNRGLSPGEDHSGLGDGAVAVLIEKSKSVSFLGQKEVTDGTYNDFIQLKSPFLSDSSGRYFTFSSESKHTRFLLSGSLKIPKELLAELKLSAKDITWFIPHQVNEKMISVWTKNLGFNQEQMLDTFSKFGNMSAVNIPMTLYENIYISKKIKRGDTILFFAPGAGLHITAVVWRF